jgi:hypothetical protein
MVAYTPPTTGQNYGACQNGMALKKVWPARGRRKGRSVRGHCVRPDAGDDLRRFRVGSGKGRVCDLDGVGVTKAGRVTTLNNC